MLRPKQINRMRQNSAGLDRFRMKDFMVSSRPDDPSSTTRPTGRLDCNRSAMAGFAAAHGQAQVL